MPFTIFDAASSTAVRDGTLAGSALRYAECDVKIGLEQASLVDMPPLTALHDLDEAGLVMLKYLLWGDCWPEVARHDNLSVFALDPATADGIHRLLQELNATLGITMVIVTHNERLAAGMGRIIRMADGKASWTMVPAPVSARWSTTENTPRSWITATVLVVPKSDSFSG